MFRRIAHLKMDELPGAGGGGAPIVTPPTTDWTTGLNESHKGVVTSKGWKDVNSVMDSYTGLEKLLGAPKEKLLRIPDDFGDEKAMGEVYDRFGRPKDSKDYGFKAEDANMDKWARDTFHKLGLSANQGKALMESYAALNTAEGTRLAGEMKVQNEQKISALKTEWGSAYDQNVNVAKAAAKQFGITEDMVNKLEDSMGFADTMKFLQTVGSKIGEAPFVSGSGASTGNGILTPEQAKQEIANLSKDAEFFKKLTSGDVQSKNRWENLNKMAVSSYSV